MPPKAQVETAIWFNRSRFVHYSCTKYKISDEQANQKWDDLMSQATEAGPQTLLQRYTLRGELELKVVIE